jgi:hypothetical protein
MSTPVGFGAEGCRFLFILCIQYSELPITHGPLVCRWMEMGWVVQGLDKDLGALLRLTGAGPGPS